MSVYIGCDLGTDAFGCLQKNLPSGYEQTSFEITVCFQVAPLVRFDKLDVGRSRNDGPLVIGLDADFSFSYEQRHRMLCVDTSFLELIFSPYGEDTHLFIVHHISLRSVCLQRRNQSLCKRIFFHFVSRCCICASKIQT